MSISETRRRSFALSTFTVLEVSAARITVSRAVGLLTSASTWDTTRSSRSLMIQLSFLQLGSTMNLRLLLARE